MRTLFILITTLIISQYANCQLPKMTVKKMVDFSNHDFRSLKIISYVHDSTDCGEWGGHYEQILIYKELDGALSYYYERKPNNCNNVIGYRGRHPQIHEKHSGVFTKEKQKYVKTYINELIKFKFYNCGASNVSNSYEVKFENHACSYGFEIEDDGKRWEKYESFKNSIIKE